jgi:transposase
MESFSKGCIPPDGPIHLLIDSTGLKVFGAGEWLQEKHGAKARRTWKKLHLAVDANTGMIMASTLTGNDVGDPSQVAPLLDQIETTIASVTADGAYDGMPTYDVVAGYGEDVRVIIPPHLAAVLSAQAKRNPSQRDQHILLIAAQGRMGWQKEIGYGQRALVETAMGRYKSAKLLRPTGRSGYRRGNPQPHAERGTPGLRPPSKYRRVNLLRRGKLSLRSIHATTPSAIEIGLTSSGTKIPFCMAWGSNSLRPGRQSPNPDFR